MSNPRPLPVVGVVVDDTEEAEDAADIENEVTDDEDEFADEESVDEEADEDEDETDQSESQSETTGEGPVMSEEALARLAANLMKPILPASGVTVNPGSTSLTGLPATRTSPVTTSSSTTTTRTSPPAGRTAVRSPGSRSPPVTSQPASVAQAAQAIAQQVAPKTIPANVSRMASLDQLLVQGRNEDPAMFKLRSDYSRYVVYKIGAHIDNPTAVVIGEIAANKAMLNVIYPEPVETYFAYIDTEIRK